MKSVLLSGLALAAWAAAAAAQYPVDTMCGAKVILDKDGKLLARYAPETPGAGYVAAVQRAVDFWKSCPNDPRNGLPLYLTYCSAHGDRNGGFRGSNWPHNPAVVNAGMVQSLAVDWRNYTGDQSLLVIARQGLDLHLQNGTTPANWDWAGVPYASADPGKNNYQGCARFDKTQDKGKMGRGDGTFVLEADKIGDMGMAYLIFHEITGEAKYLEAAIRCADALAKHIRPELHPGQELNKSNLVPQSPWPFRVKAEKGEILEDYTAHVADNLCLFDELVRIKDRITLPAGKARAYQQVSATVWHWLYAADGPIKTSIWKGYYEDMPLDPLNLNRVNNAPMEVARHLIKHPEHDPRIATTVPALIWWVKNTFGETGMNAINEQTTCYKPMGSHTARYASICALWYERTGDVWFKEEAYRCFNHATYMTEPDGVVRVGHNWGGEIWFSDGYTDYIKHFMEGLAAVPEWAPAGENHLLRSSSVVQTIAYTDHAISFTTFDDNTRAVLRLASKPASVKAGDKSLKLVTSENEEGYTWKPLAQGGVLKINNRSGHALAIRME